MGDGYLRYSSNTDCFNLRKWKTDSTDPYTFLITVKNWPTLPTPITIPDIYYYHLPKIIFIVACGENAVTSTSLAAGET